MRNRLFRNLLTAAIFATTVSGASAVLISVDTAGTNITNEGGALVPFVWQGTAAAPSSSDAATRYDWLATGGTYDPGQVQGYNNITSATLPQPAAATAVVSDDNASGNAAGYSLTAGFQYYITAHYGGYYVAWVVDATGATDTYQVPTSISGVSGADAYGAAQELAGRLDGNGHEVKYNGGGLSNVRIWQGGSSVPDGGATIALFGLSLLGVAGVRRMVGSRVA